MAECSFPDAGSAVEFQRDQACGARVALTRWCGQQAGHEPPCDPDWPLAGTTLGTARGPLDRHPR